LRKGLRLRLGAADVAAAFPDLHGVADLAPDEQGVIVAGAKQGELAGGPSRVVQAHEPVRPAHGRRSFVF
jgi:hypothetical protein